MFLAYKTYLLYYFPFRQYILQFIFSVMQSDVHNVMNYQIQTNLGHLIGEIADLVMYKKKLLFA